MESPGLRWLATDDWPPCLVFVRGASEDQVLSAFGADPGDAVLRLPGEPLDATWTILDPVVRVARVGEWIVAVEDGASPPQGIRPEVLRRVSSGGEAVALYLDIAKFNHQFGYAADGRAWMATGPGQGNRVGLRPLYRLLALGLENGLMVDPLRCRRVAGALAPLADCV